MKEVIIVGGGPAGLSAALYTARAGLATRVIARDGGALARAEVVENFFGFPAPVSGAELCERTRENARRLGVSFTEGEVTSLTLLGDGRFLVTAEGEEYLADGVILATGAERKMPTIAGTEEFFGRGVSTCAVCDAFAARGRDVAVIGTGELALHEAEALTGVARSVTILTDGAPAPAWAEGYPTRTEPIARIAGDTLVREVILASGERLPIAMVFLALGVAGAVRLAATLGLPTEGGRLKTGADMATAVPNLYAAGDCTGGFLQIATAVGEGAIAGNALARALRRREE